MSKIPDNQLPSGAIAGEKVDIAIPDGSSAVVVNIYWYAHDAAKNNSPQFIYDTKKNLEAWYNHLKEDLSQQIKDNAAMSHEINGMKFGLGAASDAFPSFPVRDPNDTAWTINDITYLAVDQYSDYQNTHKIDPLYFLRHEEGHQALYRLLHTNDSQAVKNDVIEKMHTLFNDDLTNMMKIEHPSKGEQNALDVYQKGEGAANDKLESRFSELFADCYAIVTKTGSLPNKDEKMMSFEGRNLLPESTIYDNFGDILKLMPNVLETHPEAQEDESPPQINLDNLEDFETSSDLKDVPNESNELAPDNPDSDNPDYDNPDYDNPDYDNPDYDNPDYDNPDYDNPDYDNPDYDNPDYDNPDYDNPDYDNPDHDNPDHDNPDYDNPDYDNPDYDNPDYDNPHYDDPNSDDPNSDDDDDEEDD